MKGAPLAQVSTIFPSSPNVSQSSNTPPPLPVRPSADRDFSDPLSSLLDDPPTGDYQLPFSAFVFSYSPHTKPSFHSLEAGSKVEPTEPKDHRMKIQSQQPFAPEKEQALPVAVNVPPALPVRPVRIVFLFFFFSFFSLTFYHLHRNLSPKK
jgi:hypothetical protein